MAQRVLSVSREGERLMAERKLDQAENAFREALGMNPDFIPALIDMGNLSAEKQDMVGALRYFSRAVALDPLNPSTHYNLSITYQLMGRPAEARSEMGTFRELEARSKQSESSARQ